MARRARIIVPKYPHYVTHWGNSRQQVFFGDDDYAAYIDLMSRSCQEGGAKILAYCLLPNHVNLIAVPAGKDSLRKGIGYADRRYTRRINFREDWCGYLWQGRFASCILDGDYLLAAARYIEMNPVRAGLVKRPEQWRWSSARAHLAGQDDALVKVAPLLKEVGDWRSFLREPGPEDLGARLRRHAGPGWPLGTKAFIAKLEAQAGRPMAPRRPGRKPRKAGQ